MKEPVLRLGGVEIGPGGGRITGAVEMLSTQNKIPFAEPRRGIAVQVQAPGLEKGIVDTLLHQRVGKQIVLALRPDEMALHQLGASILRAPGQMAQGIEREALAEHRGSLQCLFVGWRQAVGARQYQALNGSRNFLAAQVREISQQVLEKQWIARGAFHAVQGKLAAAVDESARQGYRILLAQRTQIKRHQGASASGAPPNLVEWKTFSARGHDKKCRTIRNGLRHFGKLQQDQRVGPMNVLDSDDDWPACTHAAKQIGKQLPLAFVSYRVLHGVV